MPKQLNVNLAFTADTGAAKQQIKSLEQDLKNLVSGTGMNKDFKLTRELAEAKEAAGQLKLALQSATSSTGTLDLSKFDQAIKASGMTLADYRQKLSAMGPEGQQAFAKLAQSIVQAEVPLRRTSALLDQFKTTLINTARWQISSSLLHGFMGALQSAYGYAQDLNSSLNNIRIVTGASVEEMAVFAENANKAAQALSTSTTSYTDAALIYYQQGIRDQEEIAGRTETTIKLANVSRQSAEDVSQQMTAIWNNFDDGSHSLEYYADAITALGASTAASSQEIAAGLEKFAAVADTVGLSYEYATAAMATITAQTRQSADTVGTGLRTIFSRLESLKLGETLDDGVDLNKYSQALKTVGVDVLDVNGELRDMDSILDDLGSRWDELTQAQKVALANTVGGVRQQANLIALMDNWDKMQENVLTAQGSEGTLQKQADIYAESWEAAQKRVKAAAQALYSDLLDDDFFITLTNGFADILRALDQFIDGIGGLRTVLPGVASLLMNSFGPQLANSIDNTVFNMMRGTEQMKAFYDQRKQEAMQEASMLYTNPNSMGDQAAQAGLERQLDLTYQLEDVATLLSEEEIKRLQTSIDTVQTLNQQAEAMGRIADASRQQLESEKADIAGRAALNAKGDIGVKQTISDTATEQLDTVEKTVKPIAQAKVELQSLYEEFSQTKDLDQFEQGLTRVRDTLTNMPNAYKLVNAAHTQLVESGGENVELARELATANTLDKQSYLDVAQALEKYKQLVPEVSEELDQYIAKCRQAATAEAEAAQGANNAAEKAKETAEKIRQAAATAGQQLGTTGQTFVTVFQGISQVTMGVSALANAFSSLSNPDLSGWEKFRNLLLGLGMGIPMVINGFGSLVQVMKLINEAIVQTTAAQVASTAATEADTIVSGQNLIVKGAMRVAEILQVGLLKLRLGAQVALTAAEGSSTVATGLLTAAINALNIALSIGPVGLLIAALAALVAIIGITIGVVKGISAAWNAHNTAAENAAAAAENLQKRLQETKQAYEDLKTSIEDYHNALDAIDALSKGTTEWKDAIRESNSQALELINTLGLIKEADYTIDKDGVIHINQEALDKAVEERAKATETAQMSATMGQATAKKVRAEADTENMARESGSYAKVNSAVDRLVNGDLKDQFAKNALSDEELKQKLDINDDDLISAIKENAQAQLQAADQYTMASEEAAKVALENNKDIQNSGYKDDISKAASNIYEDAYSAAYEKHSESLALGVSEKVFDKYAELSGLNEKRGLEFEGRNNDGKLEYSYLDENNQRQKAEVIEDEIAMTLAAAEAEEKLTEVSSGLVSQLQKLDEAGGASSEALKKFLSEGDLNSAKKSELDMLSAHTKKGTESKEYLGKVLGDKQNGLSDEEAQQLGYDSADALVKAFNEGLQNAQDNIEKAGQDVLEGSLKRSFDQLVEGKDLSAGGKDLLAQQINQAFEQGGSEGAQVLIDLYNNVPADKMEEAIQAMGDMDWDTTSPSEFADKMAELGVNIDAANPNVATFIDMMREAAGITFEGAVDSFHKLNEIAEKVNQEGDTISAEDYKELPAAAKEFFKVNLDGEYELVGKAEELKALLEGTALNDAKELYNQGVDQQNAMGYAMENDVTQSAISAGKGGQMTVDTDALQVQVSLVQALGEASGMTAEQVEKLCNQDWDNIDPTNPEDVQRCQDLANAVDKLDLSEDNLKETQTNLAQSNQELADKMAMSAQTQEDLDQLFEAGAISAETYADAYKTLSHIEGVDDDHIQDMKDLGEYYAENADEIDGLSKSLKGNRKACQDVAKVITRYSEAMEEANENMDDWKDNLKPVNKGTKDYMKTVDGLRKAYGDLANKDGKKLSQSFVENRENMELLEKAMNGDMDAADQLEDAINKDFLAQIGIDTTNFDADKEYVQSAVEELTGQDFDDIEVGAELNDEGFLNALSEMVTASCSSAEQAEAYLASMGIDAEVVESSATTDETNEMTGYDVHTSPKAIRYSLPTVSGGTNGVPKLGGNTSATGYIDQVSITPQKETETSKKEQKAFSLKVKSAKRGLSSGGNFKHSAGGGGGGGGCFVAGTLISTDKGFKPIEEILPGDVVLSYNEKFQKNEYSKVLDTMIHYIWTKLYTINIGLEQIKVTDIHRFYIKRAGLAQWLPASELRAEDLVLLASGEWKYIDQISSRKAFRKVYNFEVSNNHNYYVTKTQVLAHNKGCFVADTLVSTMQGFKNIQDIKIGDIVLSYNEKIKKNEYSQVADTMIHFVQEPIYKLYIENEILQVTGIHRFYIQRNNQISWIHASDLQVNDLVLFADGSWHNIFKIESKFRFRKVFNFEVEGNHNYYVGEQQILAHNKGGRRGGGGREIETVRAERAETKQADEGRERYHVVLNQLEKLESQYKKISTAYDRAFGKDKLKLLDQQIGKQQQLIDKQKQYINEIKSYQRLDANNLRNGVKQYWSDVDQTMKSVAAGAGNYLGMGINVDANGVVTNYDQLVAANNAAYNRAVAQYDANEAALVAKLNKTSNEKKRKKIEEQREQNKRILEQAQAQYDGFNEFFEQYETTEQLLLDEQQKLIEQQNELYDQLLEKTTLIVTLKIDIEDDRLKMVDFLLNQIEDDAYKAAQKISLLGQDALSSFNKINAYTQGLKDIFSNHGVNGNSLVDQIVNGSITPDQVLQKLQASGNTLTEAEVTAMREYLSGILEEVERYSEKRVEVIEQISSVMDANMEKIERITKKMDYLKNVTESYKNIVDLTGQSFLGVTKEIYDSMEATNVELAAQATHMASERQKQAQKQYNLLYSDYVRTEKFLSDAERLAWQERLKEAEDYYQQMTEEYYSTWESALEAVQQRFESMMDNIAKEFSETMAGMAGNLEGLTERMDLRKEISEVYVPEYEKVYQLTKLTRDAQKAIDESTNVRVKQELQKVQQKILDARKSENKLSQYQIDYLQKELELKMAQMKLEEAQNIKSQVRMTRDSEGNYSYVYTADDKAVKDAESEYAAKLYEMQKLNEEYVENLQSQLTELQQNYMSAIQGAAETYGLGTAEYSKAIDDINADYQEYFDSLSDQLNSALNNQQEVVDVHAKTYVEITGDIAQANVELTTAWDQTMLSALTGFQTLEEYQSTWQQASEAAYLAVKNAAQTWKDDTDSIYQSAGTTIENFTRDISRDMNEMSRVGNETALQMEDSLKDVQDAVDNVSRAVLAWETQHSKSVQNMITTNSQLIASFDQMIAAWSGYANGSDMALLRASLNGSTQNISQNDYTDLNSNTIARFDSGGYTGDWTENDGKVAILHSKELILNQDDTVNMLQAMALLKTISNTIDLNAMFASGMLNNLTAPSIHSNSSSALEQDVHITAEFPNVTDKNEILAAFDNVINLASQYANRQ